MTKTTSQAATLSRQSAEADELLRCWPGKLLFQKNIDTLREVDSDLAESIGEVEIPPEYQPAVAKDGSVSFKRYFNDGKSQWLGKSSIPMVFAQANQKRIEIGQGNLVMQGLGHGADVLATLEKMSPYQALFVVEQDPVVIRLAFELRNFSPFLRKKQLVILLGESVDQLIDDFYQKNPGYNIIQKATILPYYSQKENQIFAQSVNIAMESCVAHLAGKVAVLMDQQSKRDQQHQAGEMAELLASGKISEIKVLHGATRYAETVVSTAQTALAGLAQLGMIVDETQYDKPDQASGYAQLQRMENLWSHMVIMVDALRGDVNPALPESATCVSLLRNPQDRLLKKEHSPAKLLGPNDFVFAASLDHLAELEEAGVPKSRIGYLPIAANTQTYQPVSLAQEETKTTACDIALVASRVDSDADSYGIKLPTHQRLWQSVAAEICDGAEKYHSGLAQRFLKRAQSCGVEINEKELLDHFGQLIENVLGDAVLRDFYASYLLKRDLNVKIWGRTPLHPTLRDEQPNFWEQSAANQAIAGEIAPGQPLNALYNDAKIHLAISSRGGVDEFLLNGIAAGAFFLVKAHPSDKKPGGLGEFFKIGKEIITFDSPNDLVRKVKQYLRDDQARKQIAQAGHQRCLADHSAAVRMQQMLDVMGK